MKASRIILIVMAIGVAVFVYKTMNKKKTHQPTPQRHAVSTPPSNQTTSRIQQKSSAKKPPDKGIRKSRRTVNILKNKRIMNLLRATVTRDEFTLSEFMFRNAFVWEETDSQGNFIRGWLIVKHSSAECAFYLPVNKGLTPVGKPTVKCR